MFPWKAACDEKIAGGNPPLLILITYCVYQMRSVVNKIQSMGIEVVHIPVGCTYLCQPIDIEINKPIKSPLQDKWEEWMTEGGGLLMEKHENHNVKWWKSGLWRFVVICM